MNDKKITILIPSAGINFDNALKPCIESLNLNNNPKINSKILIVMNGMEDRAKFDAFLNPLAEQGLIVSYLWYDKPLGYVGAINEGLKNILGPNDNPDYVVFLNDDVIVHDRGWLEILQTPFENDPLMGLVGAKSLPCPITGVDFPLGWCVMIKREVFERIGVLDTAWGLGYADDTDFCIRAINAGYHIHSYVNGWDRKTHTSVGSFPLSHVGENTMHSGKLFSLDEWNTQTYKNRLLLAEKYWEKVHVIVPVYKRYTKLDKALESLYNQYYTNVKIHVVSDGHDEKVQELVEKKNREWPIRSNKPNPPEIEYTFVEHEGAYGGGPRISVLNSLPSTEKEWVCFHDSDNLANSDWILKLWQATFLKNVGGAWGKIRHLEENKDLPEPGFQNFPVWTHIDSLNYLVRADIAKKHAEKWRHKTTGPKVGPVTSGLVTHDFDFAKACFEEKPWIFVDEVLGSHGQPMSILVQAVCWNEEKMIPFFLRHYLTFADKIIVYDGGSTDKSLELLRACDKVEIVPVPNDKMNNLELMRIRNEAWKEYREDYDWVIVCDMDEFLWHKNLKGKLEEFRSARITVPTVVGFQMISDTFPDNQIMQLYDCVREGFPDPEHLNKSMIFNPKCVDIRYAMGCHQANPIGTVVKSGEALYLLHFKFAGYTEFIERNKRMADRVSDEDKKNNWAFHYARDAQMTYEEFRQLKKKASFILDDAPTSNPLIARRDLQAQNSSIFYEIVETNQYRVFKKDFIGKNVIDVGANIGIFSLLADEYGAERIVAVEPQPPTLQILKQNVAGRSILVIDKAVGKKDGEWVEMVNRPEFSPTDGRMYSRPSLSGTETIGLDHLVASIDDGKPILLKVDCEGAEYDLFYGASLKTLGKIHTIVMETHEDIFRWEGKKGLADKLCNYLMALGFEETFKQDYLEDKVKLVRYDRMKPIDDDITVVISAFNRPELLKDQVEAIKKQTLKPKEIIVWLTKSKHWEEGEWKYADNEVVKGEGWVETHFDIPEGVTLVSTEQDLKLPARFAAALFAKTNYVLLLDDDVFPAEGYLEETLKVSKREHAVVSAYGMYYENELNDGLAKRYGDNGDKTEEAVEVDVGGHSWFGRKEWFSTFFREPVLLETEGDDLHFAYTLKKYTDVKIVVSALPDNDRHIWSNTRPEAGLGIRALHARKWEDVKIWTDPTKTSWGVEDKDYLEKNLNDFNRRRQAAMEKYRTMKNWNPIQTRLTPEVSKTSNRKVDVTVDIATKNRYYSTLPLTILSVLMQTHPIKKIIIVDDSDNGPDGKMIDLRNDPMYQYLFSMISKKGIEWEVLFGPKKGQHHNHQIVLDRAKTDFIWRLDDDEYAEPNVLQDLVNLMTDGVGAVAGLVLDPKLSQMAPPNYFNTNKLSDIDTRENMQWLYHPKGKVIPVEHLYSSFLYRKVEDIKYCLELSPAAHREETLFSHEYVRKGWKIFVTTDAITWHFRNPQGGIRDHANPDFWSNDDKIFKRKLASWSIPIEGKIFQIDAGIGDTIVFMEILPKLIEKYKKVIVGTYYALLFKNFPIQVMHPFQVKDIISEKAAELQNVYRKLWTAHDKGRKLTLLEAYQEMFLEDNFD
jgi:FkbM family methyltransferase